LLPLVTKRGGKKEEGRGEADRNIVELAGLLVVDADDFPDKKGGEKKKKKKKRKQREIGHLLRLYSLCARQKKKKKKGRKKDEAGAECG